MIKEVMYFLKFLKKLEKYKKKYLAYIKNKKKIFAKKIVAVLFIYQI